MEEVVVIVVVVVVVVVVHNFSPFYYVLCTHVDGTPPSVLVVFHTMSQN